MSTDTASRTAGRTATDGVATASAAEAGSGAATAPEPSAAPGAASSGPRRPRIVGRAPARPAPAAAFHSVTAATAALLGLVAIGAAIHEPVLIPPLAASAALVHCAPTLPLAQPRSVVVGHLLGAAAGYAVAATAGGSTWAAAIAAGVALALTTLARTPHSPACATAVVIVLQSPAPGRFVPLLLGATVLLVLTAFTASRIRRGAPRYPAYWW
ncbi:HPP family protein [Streptomyces sp. NPDC015130]|uniref:HPP family protein n=1 Tax=Streptomyces sp. NPDC015130 TaxID=3364940 RepID=UPI0036FA104C